MRAPAFWWQDAPHPAAITLAPVGALYGAIAARRMARKGLRLPVPVLCVGNFVVGGAGKTPTAIALAKTRVAADKSVFFLSRGYRSTAERGPPLRVDPAYHTAQDVGDEALLLARVAPTIVAADRAAAARLALSQGAGILILDDGLQNPSLDKDLRLAVVDGMAGIGNGLCLPAGPLRAPLRAQLDRVDAVVIAGAGDAGAKVADQARALGKPVSQAEPIVADAIASKLAKRRVYAFTGIGRPAKFYATLSGLGVEIAGTKNFADHHFYRRGEITDLQRAAESLNAILVTTEKDFVRLAGRDGVLDPRFPPPLAVPVEMRFSDGDFLDGVVANVVRDAE